MRNTALCTEQSPQSEAHDIAILLLTVAGNIIIFINCRTRRASLGLTSTTIMPEFADMSDPAAFTPSSPLGIKFAATQQEENVLRTPESSRRSTSRSAYGRGKSSNRAGAEPKSRFMKRAAREKNGSRRIRGRQGERRRVVV